DDGTRLGADVPAAAYALRGGRGGEVEGPRRRRPPVDQKRLVVALFVEDPDAADIGHPVVVKVQPTKAEATLHPVVLGDALGVHRHGAVTLGASLQGAAAVAQGLGKPLLSLGP